MRHALIGIALVALSAPVVQAQSNAYRAAPSTRATAVASLTLADTAAQRAAGKPALISIDYGQPHLRGRRINTSELVPLGTVWRLGANDATILTTDVDLTIGGTVVPKGRYILMALPEASRWTLILQEEKTGGPVMVMAHDPAKDFARVALTRSTSTTAVESLSITLVPSTASGGARGALFIAWDTVVLTADWSVR